MKLSKNALVAALALNGALGCTMTYDHGVPPECDSVGELDKGTKVLSSKAEVEDHCASDLAREEVRQRVLTCVYDLAIVGEDQYDLLTVETNCDSKTLDQDLNEVFNGGQNDVAYCVSNDQDLYCE